MEDELLVENKIEAEEKMARENLAAGVTARSRHLAEGEHVVSKCRADFADCSSPSCPANKSPN